MRTSSTLLSVRPTVTVSASRSNPRGADNLDNPEGPDGQWNPLHRGIRALRSATYLVSARCSGKQCSFPGDSGLGMRRRNPSVSIRAQMPARLHCPFVAASVRYAGHQERELPMARAGVRNWHAVRRRCWRDRAVRRDRAEPQRRQRDADRARGRADSPSTSRRLVTDCRTLCSPTTGYPDGAPVPARGDPGRFLAVKRRRPRSRRSWSSAPRRTPKAGREIRQGDTVTIATHAFPACAEPYRGAVIYEQSYDNPDPASRTTVGRFELRVASDGNLAVTGIDLRLVAASGVVLIAAGLCCRWLLRRPT